MEPTVYEQLDIYCLYLHVTTNFQAQWTILFEGLLTVIPKIWFNMAASVYTAPIRRTIPKVLELTDFIIEQFFQKDPYDRANVK